MKRKFDNILQAIGRTPIVRLNRLAPSGCTLWVKIESFNPMGSVKDRLALGIIERAEQTGALEPGQTVIEATSGNTGIGLAMVCAQKGYPLVVTMAENFSVERRRMMRFLGAKVVLTPAALKGSGMLAKATELAQAHGWFLCRQFENEANADAHSATTAPEILEAFEGERLDYWVTGFGTGGTLKGVARVLARERPETQIVVCEPDNSQILGSGIAQERRGDGAPTASHPMFRPHLMQGWSPDFIPKLTEDVLAMQLIDRIVPVAGLDALRLARELARREGIFVGISAGATLAGPRAQPGPAQSYVVEKGDTLAGIADKLLGDSDKWTVIARVNRIEEPEKLAVGTRLEIPEDAGQTTSDREAAVPENEPALKNQPAPDAKGN
jgi:cysteine synthase A